MSIIEYLSNLNLLYSTGNAREHSYRGDLQTLIKTILPECIVTNEPARIACGAPDFMVSIKNVPIGYIEAKDIGVDLNSKSLKEQFERYKLGLSNLIITDYLSFWFYKDGELITQTRIGTVEDEQIISVPENFDVFTHLIKDFSQTVSQTIKSPNRLATMMAGKAIIMADVIEKSLNQDDIDDTRSNIKSQMLSFKQLLIKDITNKSFADIYAQTICYGMFAARYHDPTLESFSRSEAARLIPKSNPFLRKLFMEIAGIDLDDRLVWIVDDLVTIFLASDVSKIMKNFGKSTKQTDPVVHFYETFLGEYNPKLKKSRGVWYTPQPVVNFIVRAVDDVLKLQFKLPSGLADTSKTRITVKVPTNDRRAPSGYKSFEKEVHKIQILDVATGTGTFLAEVVRQIYGKFNGQQGMWSNYVKKDLIPRLNGFELLMASYAMAHLKLDMLLTETGFTPSDEQRFRIFLTNTLEEAHPDYSNLFSSWLTEEATQADTVKKDSPVMCVIGNPPYSSSSSNNSPFINDLIELYKKDVDEVNKNALKDDYVKFIRYGHYLINKNGEGVLAYISNNSFLDGTTHRQMRKELLTTFDNIYIINLHGDANKAETTPTGGKDQNVFDIKQGVSINIFVKTTQNKDFANINYFDLYGKRDLKYEYLLENNLNRISWKELTPLAPYYFFAPKDLSEKEGFDNLIELDKLFNTVSGGIKFRKDNLLVKGHFSIGSVINMLSDMANLNNADMLKKYDFSETEDWKLDDKRRYFLNPDYSDIKRVTYRPFDTRYTFYPLETANKIITRGDSKKSFMHNLREDNVVLITTKKNRQLSLGYVWITRDIFDLHALDSAGDSLQSLPLYTYSENPEQYELNGETARRHNLNEGVVNGIAEKINHAFLPDDNIVCELSEGLEGSFSPLDVFDYTYAVLHSPTFRIKYKAFLKFNFPRVPQPYNAAHFWELVEIGKELRELHLLESPLLNDCICPYDNEGDNVVTRGMTPSSPGYMALNDTHGNVWINDTQYFANVPLVAWEFYVGGYQPAQKWLKDRQSRELHYDDIIHYQRIIKALNETQRLMKKVDEVGVEFEQEVLNK